MVMKLSCNNFFGGVVRSRKFEEELEQRDTLYKVGNIL